MEITIHTGLAGDYNTINIDWFDENNVEQKSILEINVLPHDEPRTLVVIVNGVILATIPRRND